jgi:RNA recognition motif-containing protein
MMFYCSIFSAIFFLIGLLLGRRWKSRPVGGGYHNNNNRRPDFKRPAFQQGRPQQQQQQQPPVRQDGPVELYVGNLALEVTKEEVEAEFGKYGKVLNIRLITKQGEDKSFGFVEMATPAEADEAIKAMAGKDYKGNALEVNVAKSPRGHHRRRRR